MTKIVILSALILAVNFSVAQAEDRPSLFDKPTQEKHLPLPLDRLNPQSKPMLSCFYYPHLMVKQIDMGEVGAAQLSLTYITKDKKEPPCRQQNAKDEVVINSSAWNGYFKGVKGDYVFFDAADGSNGGVAFAVFSANGNIILRDVIVDDIHSIELMMPVADPEQRPWYENPIILHYSRLYLAPCSLRSNETACWDTIKKVTGLTEVSAPDCHKSYEVIEADARKNNPSMSLAQVDADPSVIIYEIEAVLDSNIVIHINPTSDVKDCFAAE
jgi:hypothetical protein